MHLMEPDSDCERFRILSAGKPPGAVRTAQQELYARHAGYLLRVLRGPRGRLLAHCEMGAEDLVHETFVRAFERADSYRCLNWGSVQPPSGAVGGVSAVREEEERLRTRAWLGRIAERLLADALAKRREVSGSLDMVEFSEAAPPSSGSSQAVLVRRALLQLDEREQDVLRITALYHRVGEKHQRLPNDVVRELAARWNISGANLRAIRKRALAKLRRNLEAAMQQPHAEDGAS